jgi:hypothetical protein
MTPVPRKVARQITSIRPASPNIQSQWRESRSDTYISQCRRPTRPIAKCPAQVATSRSDSHPSVRRRQAPRRRSPSLRQRVFSLCLSTWRTCFFGFGPSLAHQSCSPCFSITPIAAASQYLTQRRRNPVSFAALREICTAVMGITGIALAAKHGEQVRRLNGRCGRDWPITCTGIAARRRVPIFPFSLFSVFPSHTPPSFPGLFSSVSTSRLTNWRNLGEFADELAVSNRPSFADRRMTARAGGMCCQAGKGAVP